MFFGKNKKTTITVDGLPVEVNAAKYVADPIKVESAVRAAQAAQVKGLSDLYEEFPDYDTLEAIAAHKAGL